MNHNHRLIRCFAASLFICLCTLLSGQNVKLAQEYMNNGEYEKASYLYNALLKKDQNNTHYLERYIECLNLLGEGDKAKFFLEDKIKANPSDPNLYVQLGKMYSLNQEEEQAEKYFEKAIENLNENQAILTRIANTFYRSGKYDYALRTYKKGREVSRDEELYAYPIANLHNKLGQQDEMIKEFLICLRAQPNYTQRVQTVFTESLEEDGLDVLEITLYEYIQDYPEIDQYPELLQWLYIMRRDFQNAFRQAKAIDLRKNEQGQRVFEIAQTASNAESYDAAISGFRYIVDQKGPSSTLYVDAQRELLRNQRYKITRDSSSTSADMLTLETDYENFIAKSPRKSEIASIIVQYAQLQVYFLDNLNKGIELLNGLIETPSVNKYILAKAKLELADFYLIKGEIWEASLLNSQVDKAFGEDLLGHEARFRNAKLSYFNGDFEWAQTQFKVLKASTSKLIANDALDMNVFITDNLGLDTTTIPMSLYAGAELSLIQHKYAEAQSQLDSIKKLFPDHGLLDDVVYLEARQAAALKNYDLAVEKYHEIIENYAEDIRGDNAIYELAQLYDYTFSNKEKALELYEKIFIDYVDSVFVTESRKRYRQIRELLGKSDVELVPQQENP